MVYEVYSLCTANNAASVTPLVSHLFGVENVSLRKDAGSCALGVTVMPGANDAVKKAKKSLSQEQLGVL